MSRLRQTAWLLLIYLGSSLFKKRYIIWGAAVKVLQGALREAALLLKWDIHLCKCCGIYYANLYQSAKQFTNPTGCKMKTRKSVIWMGLSTALLFFLFSVPAFGIMPAGQGMRFESGGAPPPKGYTKRFEVFKDMSGGVLRTERNTYDLTGVKVTYSDTAPQDRPTGRARSQKIVGLIFLNSVLKEVVIYP